MAMQEARPTPLIGVPSDVKWSEGQAFHSVGDKYVRALAEAAGALPFAIPSLGHLLELRDLVHRLDGLMLTGSPSNVHPTHYRKPPSPEAEPYDPIRDETTLPLIKEALLQGIPLLAICRGMQELNVALGGSLHARVHELEGRMDHRRPRHDELDVQYGARHQVHFEPDGVFARLAGTAEITVNSLHWQAIDRLAEGLRVEGRADDGTIEAVAVSDARDFALGVQWHPEYKPLKNTFSVKLFEAFGKAARKRARARAAGSLAAPVAA